MKEAAGSEKVKKICDVLRRETLEPAKHEAEEIILDARRQAESLIEEAKKNIEQLHLEARQEIDRQKNIFQSSLHQACKQALESLKQNIESKLLNQELSELIVKSTQSPQVLSRLIMAAIHAIEKEGVEADLSVYIPAAVPAREVNEMLGKEWVEKLKEKSVLIGPLSGGIEVKLHDKNITIDVSDAALKELVSGYIRKDFRDMFFA
ncbi:MAG TPA: V-type ATP synthase subunit E [Rhabdochlamydiaceae bacterium]|jgi:V/A-type H+-transporting ATPase subunit E